MDLRVGTGPGQVPPGTGIILIRVQLTQPKIRDWDMQMVVIKRVLL